MLDKKLRTCTLLDAAIKEMELIIAMTEQIEKPADFGSSLDGLVVFRACGMSLQYVTESFVKIRNLGLAELFDAYPQIPWKHVFGMRNSYPTITLKWMKRVSSTPLKKAFRSCLRQVK